MCGCFGFVSGSTKGPDLGRLRAMAESTQTRGAHAFGFAWVDEWGTLRMFKQAGRIIDNLALLNMVKGCRMLIGHCRHATRGDARDTLNAHPHPVNGGWLVHNGRVPDYDGLLDDFRLTPVSQCDSEVIGMLAELYEGDDRERLTLAVKTLKPVPAVVLALWGRPRRLVAVRRAADWTGEKPLHTGVVGRNCYLASLPDALPGKVAAVPNDTVVEFRRASVRYHKLDEKTAARG